MIKISLTIVLALTAIIGQLFLGVLLHSTYMNIETALTGGASANIIEATFSELLAIILVYLFIGFLIKTLDFPKVCINILVVTTIVLWLLHWYLDGPGTFSTLFYKDRLWLYEASKLFLCLLAVFLGISQLRNKRIQRI